MIIYDMDIHIHGQLSTTAEVVLLWPVVSSNFLMIQICHFVLFYFCFKYSDKSSFFSQIHCFVHAIDQCKQEWYSVYSLIEADLCKIKIELPWVTELFLRSDNAGCYHNASLL